ncbi:MAG: OmpH family outer membrane protein [Gammaproteobacteria bacterium]|nr:OmpH family outer membrane protein [Gammaproteobacteria bacterium]
MRKLFTLYLLLSLVVPVSAFAEEMKIGVVNTARILNEAPQVKMAREQLQKEFSEREQGLGKIREELKRKEEKLQRDSAIMNEEQRRQLEHELVNGKRDFVRAQNEFREDLNIRQNEVFSKVQNEIQQVIHQLAREQQFDLVLENYVYTSQRVDITSRVLQRLNQQADANRQSGAQGN